MIQIDSTRGISIYYQIAEQLQREIFLGNLSPGTLLPPTRDLAHELGISYLTVLKAYHQLEQMGLVTCRQGHGTAVNHTIQREHERVARKEWQKNVARLIDEGISLRIEEQEVTDFIHKKYAQASVKTAVAAVRPDPEMDISLL